MENYFDRIEKKAKENWLRYMKEDGITEYFCVEEFYAEMQRYSEERVRAKNCIESKIPTTVTIGSIFKGGLSNYFIVSDICYGEVCKKCGTSGAVILILDKNYSSNLDKKVFLPSFEYYYVLGINPEDIELLKYPPIPVNPGTDYWYCPYCNELHRFKYDSILGLKYDQEIVNMNVDINKYVKKNDDLSRLMEIRELFR